MTIKKYFLAATMTAGMATGASAATFSYDYTGFGNPASGPALSCTATGVLNNGTCSVTPNNDGLGVDGVPDNQPDEVDGSPLLSAETLTFDFGFDRVWDNITFGLWDTNDDVTLTWADGSLDYGPNQSNGFVNLGGVTSSFLTVEARGAVLPFGGFLGLVPADGFGGNDSFTVAKLNVSAVPLPAAGWLLVAGLGGLGALRRRKKAATA